MIAVNYCGMARSTCEARLSCCNCMRVHIGCTIIHSKYNNALQPVRTELSIVAEANQNVTAETAIYLCCAFNQMPNRFSDPRLRVN